ncbi:MAG TPA: ABC transporter ATP-binding protein [Steroidobacteraceae bacterium]|nr:ABC transporter ATP-binding protein [Steroidobacteraceae bacterium]
MRLELRDLTRSFDGVTAVDGLSLVVAAGRIGCLLGPSGSGKTTVLRCIAGFEHPDAGEVLAGGERLSGPGVWVPPERRRIGMVFQDYALFPHLDAFGNAAFGLRGLPAVDRRRRAMEMLELVGLADHARKMPHELSGGQQQRVALARALAPRPRLVLLDEPFSNLDAEVRMDLAQHVRTALLAEGATSLLVTHDQREAFAIADEIGVMRAGRLEQWDAPWRLYHSPATRFVADFVGEGAFIEGTVLGPGRVSTELGVVEGQLTLDRPVGTRVDLLLRPDDVIHDDASELRAEVVDRVFRGAQFRYTLRLPSGATALSFAPSHHDHAPGERIGIRLDAQHLVGFPRD